ncbi:pilus assembly protein FimV [Psychrobacter sp. ANT_H56B]|uniref:FimV/HubP family polar landmark protein n=1 Tax=Psychrobacter sp. ANT_H56B TaxID=2597353 RepID=UPI0011F0BAD2|nr:FimV/HubP family polar landmark protein [Psychrobacter sp. ANT_H56B]KAA0929451.1 pilus assembly protein FimV [Psychrobacter sp. ANT_H56B]
MDNMLYIIAGLVVILLVAVLVMRKNKAQKPSEHLSTNTGKIEPLSKHATSRSTPTQTAINHEKKFDHIEIAQRFMDQQRYDKAIETLNRGLSEKPNDSQLSLKLLAVYATIDESENFNKVYDAIKVNNDDKSIAQADELKALLTEEKNQVDKRALSADNSQSAEFEKSILANNNQNAGFESLDFDLPTNKASSNSPILDTNTVQNVEYKNDLSEATNETSVASNAFDDNNFDDIEQAFDLSLSDLEDGTNKPVHTSNNSASVTTLDVADEDIFAPATVVMDTDNSPSTDNDFDFDFELSEHSLASTEAPTDDATDDATDDSFNSSLNELSLEDDFVLELDSDADTNNVINNAPVTTETTYLDDDHLTLSLHSDDVSNETPDQIEIQHSIVEDNFEDFSFEDISIEDANIEDASAEEIDIIKNESDASSSAPTTLMFDDDTVIDDDFDFNSLSLSESTTASTPVEVDSEYANTHLDNAIDIAPAADTSSTEDFSSRFAADFDFVKSLDSNQVTLDLAGQYVQLGEYDSAKRLLNEVIAKGNSEQQQQAQRLLDRTA